MFTSSLLIIGLMHKFIWNKYHEIILIIQNLTSTQFQQNNPNPPKYHLCFFPLIGPAAVAPFHLLQRFAVGLPPAATALRARCFFIGAPSSTSSPSGDSNPRETNRHKKSRKYEPSEMVIIKRKFSNHVTSVGVRIIAPLLLEATPSEGGSAPEVGAVATVPVPPHLLPRGPERGLFFVFIYIYMYIYIYYLYDIIIYI